MPKDNNTVSKQTEVSEINTSLFREFLEFIMVRKRYWLLPIFFVILLLSGLVFFAETSAVAPFIYTLF